MLLYPTRLMRQHTKPIAAIKQVFISPKDSNFIPISTLISRYEPVATFWGFSMVRTRQQCDLMLRVEYEKWKGIKPSCFSEPVSSQKESKGNVNVDTESDSENEEVIHILDSEDEEGASVSPVYGLRKKGDDAVTVNLVDDDEDYDLDLGSDEQAKDTAPDLRSVSNTDDDETHLESESDSVSSEEDDSEDYDFDVAELDEEEDNKEECQSMDIECEMASQIRARTRSVTRAGAGAGEESKTTDVGKIEIGCKKKEGESGSEKRNSTTIETHVERTVAATAYDEERTSRITQVQIRDMGYAEEAVSVMDDGKPRDADGKDGDLDSTKEPKKEEETHGQTIEKSNIPLPLKFTIKEPEVKSESKLAKGKTVCEEVRTSRVAVEVDVKSKAKDCSKAETVCEDERTSRVTGRITRTKQVQNRDMECEEEEEMVSENSTKSVQGKSWIEESGKKEIQFEIKNDNPVTATSTRKIEKVNFWGSGSKKLDIYSVMVNVIWKKDDDKPPVVDEEDHYDVGLMKGAEKEGQTIEKPKVPLPLKFTFGVKEPEPVMKSESELEMDALWDEMDLVLRYGDVGSNTYREASEAKPAAVCKHEFVTDDEIGVYCRFCYMIKIEIRDVMPHIEKLPTEVQSRKGLPNDHDHDNHNDISFDQCKANFYKPNNIEDGTVWDLISGTRGRMYPHQQEGFEFLWKNLAGSIDIKELSKMSGLNVGGGCIISHAPGTGKTFLSIAFLQSFLKQFPDCRPVIMAPASLLLTWAEEFRKWKVGIPFHNLSSIDLSGNEDNMIMSGIISSGKQKESNYVRMAKLYSWIKKESVLGISYSLYERLVGDSETPAQKNSKSLQQVEDIKKILLEKPGLIVFDEGHTPRNDRSRLWKTLIKLQTEKRIILSGTPFQNNFHELYNTLKLVRPASIAGLPPVNQFGGRSYRKRKSFQLGDTNGKNTSVYKAVSEVSIEDLRKIMSPFLHVHKGNILQKSLPGLKDCVVVLNPCGVQEQLIKIVEGRERSQNVLDFEHKLSLVSIHPSLFLHCSLSEKEKSLVNEECGDLKQLELNHSEGVKTRFVVEFLGIMQATKEKVLIFSQYIPPLCMIMKQLSLSFKWAEGTEILYMHGKLDNKQRQVLIHTFNDPDSKAKVFLASTKACSEGISLVGASRVVLLDVVWNPSVERQAISRAYRIGQKRLVYTYHLIIKDTTEWDKYMKQAEKDRMAERVFSGKNKEDGNAQAEVSCQDEILDELYHHEKLADMFDKVIYHPKEATHLVETFDSVVYF